MVINALFRLLQILKVIENLADPTTKPKAIVYSFICAFCFK